MTDLFYKEEFYKIIGLCMEVHRQLGIGFKEIIYKDALENRVVSGCYTLYQGATL